MTKQFLIQVRLSEDTKEIRNETHFVSQLQRAAEFLMMTKTTGPLPAVTVIQYVDAEIMDLSRELVGNYIVANREG